MISSLKKFFEESLSPIISSEEDVASEMNKRIEFATAALFVELVNSDYKRDKAENDLMFELLKNTFDLDATKLSELVQLAEDHTATSHDLYQFTSLINEHYSSIEKITLLENCWKLAYADGNLDKYEEHFIRKIAGLINLPPSEFIKTKLRIQNKH